MSKTLITKLTSFTLILTVTLAFTLNINSSTFNNQAHITTPCMAIESKLPINHNNHPCNSVSKPKNNWLSWLTNENKSAHLHFLDLVELLHYSFY